MLNRLFIAVGLGFLLFVSEASGATLGYSTEGRDCQHYHYVREGNGNWLRLMLHWEKVNPRQGKWDWSYYDDLIAEAKRQNLRLFVVLTRTPNWLLQPLGISHSGFNSVAPPPQLYERWRDFNWRVVQRYGTEEIKYQVWNEPNLYTFWGRKTNPWEYLNLFRQSARIIPKRALLPAGIAMPRGNSLSYAAGDFLRPIWRELRNSSWDERLSIHPYPTWGKHPSTWVDEVMAKVRGIREVTNGNKLIIGEWGYSTTATTPINENTKALLAKGTFQRLDGMRGVGPLVYYWLGGHGGAFPPWDGISALTPEGVRLPVWYALRDAVR